jgi:hypothetical protein
LIASPLVHLNGSGAASLTAGYEAASSALREALTALEATAPNARDYYQKGDSAFREAAREHSARVAAIRAVLDELCAIHSDITDQVDAKNRRSI